MTGKETLEAAIEAIGGHREQDYDVPERNFRRIAKLWSMYTGCFVFTAHDVAMMLALLKMARIMSGRHHEDNYVDLAGYAALANELKYDERIGKCKEIMAALAEELKKDPE